MMLWMLLVKPSSLHDKNGNEIWEGDIVITQRRKDGTAGQQKVVEWRNYVRKGSSVGFNIAGSPNMEVIGNIYENPELLTKEKEG